MRPLSHQYCIYCDHYFETDHVQLCRASLCIDGVCGEKSYSYCSDARGGKRCEFSTEMQEHELGEIQKELDELKRMRSGFFNAIRWRGSYVLPIITALCVALAFTVAIGLVSESFETMVIVGLASVFVALVLTIGVCTLTYYWEKYPTQSNIQFFQRRQLDLSEKIQRSAEQRGRTEEDLSEYSFDEYNSMDDFYADWRVPNSFPDCITNAFEGPEKGKVDEYLLVCSYDDETWREPIVPLSVAQEALRLERTQKAYQREEEFA